MQHRLNRRGQTIMGMSLETLGKLALYSIMLILTVGMIYALVQLFVSGEQHIRALNNFKLFVDRIDETQEKGLKPPESSVILQMPKNYLIIGFDKNEQVLHFSGQDSSMLRFLAFTSHRAAPLDVERPGSCKNTCVCLYNIQEVPQEGSLESRFHVELSPVKCEQVDADTIQGEFSTVRFEKDMFNLVPISRDLILDVPAKGGGYTLAFGTQPPRNVMIMSEGRSIRVSADVAES